MITILNGKLTIPESERFIGFAGDNLRRTIKFLISGAKEADRIYRLYLTFDDGTVNYFVLPSQVTDEGVVLTWQVLREHIFMSGNVRAQLKAFSDSGVVYHTTTDRFFVGESAEFSDHLEKNNTEFLEYEQRLNELAKTASEICVLMPFIGDNGNWYIYDAEAGEYIDSGKPSVGKADSIQLKDGAIDRASMFSYDMIMKYLSMPVFTRTVSGKASQDVYNSLTTPGIYKVDDLAGTHQVVVVLKPSSESFLMQIRFSYNKIEYRGIWCTEDGVYADEDWEEWTEVVMNVDSTLSAESENPLKNKAIYFALDKKMNKADVFNCVGFISDNVDPQIIAYQTEDQTTGDMLRIPMSLLIEKSKRITDQGEYYVSETVDGALQEIGSSFAQFAKLNTILDDVLVIADSCENLLSNVSDNTLFMASNKHWTDTPTDEPVVFMNLRYSTNYDLQISVSISNSGLVHTRVVNHNTRKVFIDWGSVSGTTVASETVPRKVLAVGDSICSGSRNNGKGFVGDLGLEYRNAGLGKATLSNYRTTVANIPDQLVGVTDFTPDIIIAQGGVNDYYYHVPLGTVSDVPVTTDEQAAALDRSTLMGGLEYLFYKMINLYPEAQRFFLISHKTYATACSGATEKAYWVTHKNNAGYTQQDMHDAIVECCKAYNVQVIDVFEDGLINTLFDKYVSDVAYSADNSVNDTQYADTDGIHPLSYGYLQGYVPLIKKAIGVSTVK